MSDLDRLLGDSLKSVGDGYSPSNPGAARQEFLRRRQRRRIGYFAGGLAFAGAAAVAALFVFGQTAIREDAPEEDRAELAASPSGFRASVTEIRVGDGPLGVAYHDGSLYVVNSRDATVWRVDPATEEMVDRVAVDSEPDDVVASSEGVWISDPPAQLVKRLDFGSAVPDDGGFDGITVGGQSDAHLDIALGFGSVWVTSRGQPAAEVHAKQNGNAARYPGLNATDVAVDPSGAWFLDGSDGVLYRVDPSMRRVSRAFEVPFEANDNADMAVGAGSVWAVAGNDGVLFQIDPSNGRVVSRLSVTPGYSSIAIGEGAVWVASTDQADRHVLTRVDPLTGEKTGELELTEQPYDVAAGAGSVWVTNYETDTLTRVRLTGADEARSPQPSPSQGGVRGRRIAFVYSNEGDIWAQLTNGHALNLTNSPDEEGHPALSPDGTTLVYERVGEPTSTHPDGVSELVRFDVSTGERAVFADGSHPAFAPDGELAWVGGTPRRPEIVVGSPFSREKLAFPALRRDLGVPMDVRNLAWDQSKELIYYETGYEGWALMRADVVLDADQRVVDIVSPDRVTPVDYDEGSTYLAPAAMPGSDVTVVKACCRMTEGDPYETAELGSLELLDAGVEYRTLMDLDGIGLQAGSHELFLVNAGFLDMRKPQGTVRWTYDDSDSWFVGDGERMWLLDDGDARLVPLRVDAGAAAPLSPSVAREWSPGPDDRSQADPDDGSVEADRDGGSADPEPIDGFEQGARYWGVYVFVGRPRSDGYDEAIERLQDMGLVRGRNFSDGQLACDKGAARALGARRSAWAVAAYFHAEDDAREFAASLEPPPEGVAHITAYCAD